MANFNKDARTLGQYSSFGNFFVENFAWLNKMRCNSVKNRLADRW